MILSAINSFLIHDYQDDKKSQILPTLHEACRLLKDRGFQHVDVLIDSQDLKAARDVDNGDCLETKCLFPAKKIAEQIRKSVRAGGTPLVVSALATNIPNISSLSDDARWKEAIEDLTACLLVADIIHARAIEIVCGRRIIIERSSATADAKITDYEDKNIAEKARMRLAEGIVNAFINAKTALGGKRFPYVGVALEMEPDILALASNHDEWYRCLRTVRSWIKDKWNGNDTDKDALLKHIGLNLDIGHFIVAKDRELDPTVYINRVEHILASEKKAIFHAHIGDHALGGHWVDAPVCKFHDPNDYKLFIQFYENLVKIFKADRSPYFTGVLAIELEACGCISPVVLSRDKILHLCDKWNTSYTNDDAVIEDLQRMIAQLPPTVLKKGWMEGINYTIYQSIKHLVQEGEEPRRDDKRPHDPNDEILREEEMNLIEEFLRCRATDNRIDLALGIARRLLDKLGLGIMAEWLTDLNQIEYDRNFYPEYRDHTTHSVMVYLLGLYLYSESSKVRRLVQYSKEIGHCEEARFRPCTKDWFSRCWLAAALCHDLGYIFECDSEKVRNNACNKLKEYAKRFIQKVITIPLTGAKVIDNHAESINKLIARPQFDGVKDLTVKSIPTEDFFSRIGNCVSKSCEIPPQGFSKIFDLLSSDSKTILDQDRKWRPFYDHGIMSAALLQRLLDIRKKWYEDLKSIESSLISTPDLPRRTIDAVKQWVNNEKFCYTADELDYIEEAIAVHNLYSEHYQEVFEGAKKNGSLKESVGKFWLR
ncbi:MAG: hypothetical protein NTX50_30015 [Candidatus Sumerlaeota bacterium]|nr:hypothetical protein [Candidatus Sumerlaeota bacterium]